MSKSVTLTPPEIVVGATVGGMRHAESIKEGRKNAHGLDPDSSGLSFDVEGASAEMALAKFLGKYWPCSVNTFKEPDVSRRIQVRQTSKHTNRLIVRPNDKDGDIFVLVTGVSPTYQIHGWMYGHEAKVPRWKDAPASRPPAWFVPPEALNSITTLPDDA